MMEMKALKCNPLAQNMQTKRMHVVYGVTDVRPAMTMLTSIRAMGKSV